MIDSDGYRLNVGIILCDQRGRLFWAKRIGQKSWQFPQGGIKEDECPLDAMYRELHEEVGLEPDHVELIASSSGWLTYRLPQHLIRQHSKPVCIGQKQRWFMLRMTCEETMVRFDRSSSPEFDSWRWVEYWKPLDEVVFFKRQVYRLALDEFAPFLFPSGAPPRGDARKRNRN